MFLQDGNQVKSCSLPSEEEAAEKHQISGINRQRGRE